MLGGLIGSAESGNNKISNSYNLGEVIDGIAGDKSSITWTNVKGLSNDATLNVSEIYKTWSIDKDGSGTRKLWRVYAYTDNPNDTTRQHLLTAFLNDAKINRYTELSTEEVKNSGGEVDPASLATIENPITHTLHNSDGSEIETRYKNSGKIIDADTTAEFTKYDIVESSEDGKFSVSGKKYLSEALMNSSQFGYDFRFQDNKDDLSDVGEGEIKNEEFPALADDDDKYFTVSSDKTDDDTKIFWKFWKFWKAFWKLSMKMTLARKLLLRLTKIKLSILNCQRLHYNEKCGQIRLHYGVVGKLKVNDRSGKKQTANLSLRYDESSLFAEKISQYFVKVVNHEFSRNWRQG